EIFSDPKRRIGVTKGSERRANFLQRLSGKQTTRQEKSYRKKESDEPLQRWIHTYLPPQLTAGKATPEGLLESTRTFDVQLNCLESNSPQLAAWRYLITLSARASTFGGIVRPICLAAIRLMMNSNFFGRSTGRSAVGAGFYDVSSTRA